MEIGMLEKLLNEIKEEKDKSRQIKLMNRILNEISRQICEFIPIERGLIPFVIASLEALLEGIKSTNPDAADQAKVLKDLFKTSFIEIVVDEDKIYSGGQDNGTKNK